MKKNMITLTLISLILIGCDDKYGSPQNVLATAENAIIKNDVNNFKHCLTGLAKDNFGTDDGLNRIKNILNGYELTMGIQKQVSISHEYSGICERPGDMGYTGPFVEEVSSIDILGKKEEKYTTLFQTIITCRYCMFDLIPVNGTKYNCRISDLKL